jgi:membrane-anchored protein YejM (alkaline phosphatase superfamily)
MSRVQPFPDSDYFADVIYPSELFHTFSKHIFTDADIDDKIISRFANISKEKFMAEKLKTHWAFSTFYAKDRTLVDFISELTGKGKGYAPLSLIYLQGLDPVCHAMMKYSAPFELKGVTNQEKQTYGRAVNQYYMLTDRYIGKLLEQKDDKTIVIIVSDHGFEYEKNINNFNHHHKPPGIFIISGEPIRNNVKLDQVSIYDIMPTMLYILGLPVASDMPGRPLEEVFTRQAGSILAKTSVPTYGAFQFSLEPRKSLASSEIIDQLKSLGYLQ